MSVVGIELTMSAAMAIIQRSVVGVSLILQAPESGAPMLETGFWSLRARWGYALALAVIGLDYWTKAWASSTLAYRQPVAVTSWFDWMLAHNTGAAFSFLADAGGWQRWFFATVALVVSAVMVVWLSRIPTIKRWVGAALGLILGGGLGNLWDRLNYGYVVDFISVHYDDWYWPAFNVADSAISLGAAILILDSLFQSDQAQTANNNRKDS